MLHHAAWLHASCLMPQASCLLPHASRLMPRVLRLMPHASCLMPYASCLFHSSSPHYRTRWNKTDTNQVSSAKTGTASDMSTPIICKTWRLTQLTMLQLCLISQCASISLQSIIVWSLTAATSLFAHLTCMHLQAVPWSYLRLAGHKQQQPPSEHEGERH